MRSVEDQLAAVVNAAAAPEPIRVALTDALGLMCAEEVTSTTQVPGFPQAAVDGFAVRAVDVGGTAGLRRVGATGTPSPSTTRRVAGMARLGVWLQLLPKFAVGMGYVPPQ